jgi:hypothetical protein
MFRRIELIRENADDVVFVLPDGTEEKWRWGISGLYPNYGAIAEATGGKLRGPDCPIPRNAKFYFTERGWREIGRHAVAACKYEGQAYRIIRVKERDVNVVWRDRHYDTEVAAQPRRKKHCRRKRNGTC